MLNLIAIVTAITILTGTANAGNHSFYSQENFSIQSIVEGAERVLSQYDRDGSFRRLSEQAKNGDQSAVEQLLQLLASDRFEENSLATYALIHSGVQNSKVISNSATILRELLKKPADTRLGYTMNIMTLAITFGEKAEPLSNDLKPFLTSSNWHEIYWSVKVITSMRTAGLSFRDTLLEMMAEPNTTLSVKRYIVICLGAMGPGIGTEGFAVLEESLESFYHPIREAAALAVLNQWNTAPISLKNKTLRLKEKNDSHMIESTVAEMLTSGDQSEFERAFTQNPRSFVSSTADYLLYDYLLFLGENSAEIQDFLLTIIEHENPDYRSFAKDMLSATR